MLQQPYDNAHIWVGCKTGSKSLVTNSPTHKAQELLTKHTS